MFNFRDSSIRKKLTMIVMIATGVALVLAGTIFMAYDHYTLKTSMVHDLETISGIIGSNCTAAISFNNAADASEVLMALQAEEHIIAAVIYGDKELVLAHYVRDDHGNSFKAPPIDIPGFEFTRNALSMYRTISLDTDRLGTIYIQSDLEQLDARLYQIGIAVCLITLFCFLIVFGIVSRLQRLISVPILKLAKAARVISDEKNYSIRVDHGSHDELGVLVAGFNEMLNQIQQRDLALLEAKDELEDRVQLRTSELQREVVEHDRAKEVISASLKEKETLLKEVHHRVKNNLQIIISLLNLQSNQIRDDHALEMFRVSQARVRSMALIHEKLYQSEDLSDIDFAEYIKGLSEYLVHSFKPDGLAVNLKTDVESISLSVESAVPCGLIVNESISNALKHAFPGAREGTITVGFRRGSKGMLVLTVSDDGVGIPVDFDLERSNSLGLQLIATLTKQLKGHLHVHTDNGTTITVEFTDPRTGEEDSTNAERETVHS
ncbi:MAG: HAMP domain-containing protein [candidate division Zixibacteria bacterium]|nr:HAMP domain-containing protein [candidate division Zixibacteria bacterium]